MLDNIQQIISAKVKKRMRKTTIKLSASSVISRTKKYIPTQQQATIITNYFLHNNFQDFNTWQQISKSRCDFDYNESKIDNIQCKVTLKWDDSSMPVIVQIGVSKNKKNAKKKALKKLIENLIFLGFIGYGFKQSDFIRKMPKRRRQSSGDQSNIQTLFIDKKMQSLITAANYDEALSILSYQNFDQLLCHCIKSVNLILFVKIIRKLQNTKKQQINVEFDEADLQQSNIESCSLIPQFDPFSIELADQLKNIDLKILQEKKQQKQRSNEVRTLELPCLKLDPVSTEGKISFQFFHPIEFTLIFRRNIEQMKTQKKATFLQSYSSLYKDMELPKFFQEQEAIPMPYKVIQRILNIILEFSYNYRLVVNLLSIFERQVPTCNLQENQDSESQKFYLSQITMLTAQFAYLLNKKFQLPSISIQGLINIETDGTLNFQAKEPQEILAKKISKKININEMQEMQQFATEQFVLLVSKIDSQVVFMGQIIECWPVIKIKCHSFESEQKQKLPFTLHKLSNSKLYNRLIRSITHTSKNSLQCLRSNTFLIEQKPTQPLISIMLELTAEAISLNETVLIVSQNYNQIYAILQEKGFKVAKITNKVEERYIVKKQIICCSGAAVCADAIRNYAYTRVIIEAAQRISMSMATLAVDKGYKKLYIIGDSKLPKCLTLTKFAKNRQITKSLFQWMLEQGVETYNFSESIEQQIFEISILQFLSKIFYNNKLSNSSSIITPLIKGFPWPSQFSKLAFIQTTVDAHMENEEQAQLCCQIIANVVKSGFLGISQIACRVVSAKARTVLTRNLYHMFKVFGQLGVNPDNGVKIVDFVTGLRFRQRSLCIFLLDSSETDLKYLNAALQQSRRGLICLANFQRLKTHEGWQKVIKEAQMKNILVRYQRN